MNSIKIVVGLLLLNLLNSCVITEKINFNNDNSGQLAYNFDMSELMAMAGDKMEDSNSTTSKKKQEVDTTITFKDLYKDKQDSINSLPEDERLKLKQLENYTMRMVVSKKNKQFMCVLSTKFTSPIELQNLVSPLNAASQFNPMGADISKETPKNEGVTKYSFDGKTFSKTVNLSTKTLLLNGLKKGLKKNNSDSKTADNEQSNKMDESLKMILEKSKYSMEVSFPKKIKSISVPNAVISPDKKSAILTFSMNDYMESKNLNFEVELE